MKMRKLDQILEQCLEELELKESTLDLDKLDKLMEDAYDYEDEHLVDLNDPEEKLLSDKDIANQYNDFKCTYIKIEPSRAGYEDWFNATLELEFPDADHPDFDDSCIENLYYNRADDRWGFDGWYPDETREQIKQIVLDAIKKYEEEGIDEQSFE